MKAFMFYESMILHDYPLIRQKIKSRWEGVMGVKRLSKEEIVELIEKITDCENQSEEEIDRLTERLQQSVLDPQILDYIYWTEMPPEKIADTVLQYKPIAL